MQYDEAPQVVPSAGPFSFSPPPPEKKEGHPSPPPESLSPTYVGAYPPGSHGAAGPFPPQDHTSAASPPVVQAQVVAADSRKRSFRVVLVVLLLAALAAGLGIGMGAGIVVGRNQRSSTSTSPGGSSQSSSGSSNTTTTCPSADLTYYYPTTSSSVRFIRVCGVDFSGGNSTDMNGGWGTPGLSSFDACIDACAGTQSCVGCGWGEIGGDPLCFMKSALGQSHTAGAGDWSFAIMEGDYLP